MLHLKKVQKLNHKKLILRIEDCIVNARTEKTKRILFKLPAQLKSSFVDWIRSGGLA